MKKLLFAAYTLDVGGIETALVNLLNNLVESNDVTLVLEKKQGIFLDDLDMRVKIIEYNPNQSKNILIRKTINLLKRIKFIIKYKNKFDFGGSFATYSKMGSFCARTASKNNALWGHLNYIQLFKNSKEEMKKFFDFVKYDKFSHFIFVSKEGADNFKQVFPQKANDVIVCNNLINYKKITAMSKEKLNLKKDNVTTFLNVGRHEEQQKKLSRIIEASKILVENNYKFKVLMVGDGPDTVKYKELVKKYNLENYITFYGKEKNPYPYFELSDSVLLTSEYEGYPVVFVEALVLNKPIITTDISDAKTDIQDKYGIVTEKNLDSIYKAMEQFIKEGYNIKNKFNPKQFNKEVLSKLEKIF